MTSAKVSIYAEAAAFLRVVQTGLEQNEAENSLMLGILERDGVTLARNSVEAILSDE